MPSASRRLSNWSCNRRLPSWYRPATGASDTVEECPLPRAASRSVRTSAAVGPPSARAAPASPSGPRASVRGRVLAPTDRIRYAPGSLVIVLSADEATREAFCARVLEDTNVLLPAAGRAGSPRSSSTTRPVSCSTPRRPSGSQPARPWLIALDGFDAAEWGSTSASPTATAARATSCSSRSAQSKVPGRGARAAVDALRTALDAGELGQEGFVTSLRLGGAAGRGAQADRVRAATG